MSGVPGVLAAQDILQPERQLPQASLLLAGRWMGGTGAAQVGPRGGRGWWVRQAVGASGWPSVAASSGHDASSFLNEYECRADKRHHRMQRATLITARPRLPVWSPRRPEYLS